MGPHRLPAASLHRCVDAALRQAAKLDYAGERARTVDCAAAAADDPHLLEAGGIVGRPIDPSAERVGLRDPVEDQQCAARRVAAQRPQGHALAGRMAGRRIRAPEQLQAGDLDEDRVELVSRRFGEVTRLQDVDVLHSLALCIRQRRSGDDDRGWLGRRQCLHSLLIVSWRQKCRRGLFTYMSAATKPPLGCSR